jgi:hypothetical protein
VQSEQSVIPLGFGKAKKAPKRKEKSELSMAEFAHKLSSKLVTGSVGPVTKPIAKKSTMAGEKEELEELPELPI